MFSRALYYPFIQLPDNDWLRRAILYWEQINPIVPAELDDQIPPDHVSRKLRSEGLSDWVRPRDRIGSQNEFALLSEFTSIVSSETYLEQLGPKETRSYRALIFEGKLVDGMEDWLGELGLVGGREPGTGWVRFEAKTASLFMCYLAGALARDLHLEPVTDRKSSDRQLLFSQLAPDSGEQAFTHFIVEDLIPSPHAGVDIRKILAFRRKHEEELLRFRRAMRAVLESLEGVTDEAQAARKLDAVRDEIREQSLALSRKLRESRIQTAYSALEVSVPSKTAGLTALVSLPIGAVLGGAQAVVKIGRELLNGKIRSNSLLAESQYTYVYRIEEDLASR